MTTHPNFNRVARLYRWAEYLTLGPLLQRTRTHFLPQLKNTRHAFLLGDGDGRFLARLLQQNPDLHATAVDTSATMVALLRRRCAPAAARLHTIEADALTQTPPPATDLIVTHFFLDCLTQPQLNTLALHLAHATAPGTLWLLSDFRIPAGPIRPLARAYIRSLYFAFRLLTSLRVTRLPDPAAALSAAGFERIAHHHFAAGILYTELWHRTSPLNPSKPRTSAVSSPSELTTSKL